MRRVSCRSSVSYDGSVAMPSGRPPRCDGGVVEGVAGRPVAPAGPADWGAGVAAGLALALPLLIGTALGNPEAGAALVLPVVLVVMPLPAQAGPGERARRLATRTLWITLAGVYACLIHGNDWALVPAVALTAAVGALAPRVSVTAPLAFLLVGITGPAEAFGVPGLPQLAGCLWGGILALPRWGRTPPRPPGPRPPAPPPPVPTAPPAPPAARPLAHAARLAALTGAAMTLITAPHHLTGDGHWLVTGVLLALTPTPHTTLVKARQRAVGTSVGCTGVALVLAARPGPWAIAATVAVLGTLAYGLRPANYLYWCIAFSPCSSCSPTSTPPPPGTPPPYAPPSSPPAASPPSSPPTGCGPTHSTPTRTDHTKRMRVADLRR